MAQQAKRRSKEGRDADINNMEEEEGKKKLHFKTCSEVKGIRFGAELAAKAFTVRRASPFELSQLLAIPPSYLSQCRSRPFPSTAAYLPTNFTVLAQRAWRTLTLGLGTRRSKVVVFVFESAGLKSAAAGSQWPAVIPLGNVNRRLVRGLAGCEMARFKFRKGCLTFYVYAVRRLGATGFACADDLKRILEAVAALKDFLDHTAMLALSSHPCITT